MGIAAIIEWFGGSRTEGTDAPAPQLGDHDRSSALERLEWFRDAASTPRHPAPRAVGRVRLGMWPH